MGLTGIKRYGIKGYLKRTNISIIDRHTNVKSMRDADGRRGGQIGGQIYRPFEIIELTPDVT